MKKLTSLLFTLSLLLFTSAARAATVTYWDSKEKKLVSRDNCTQIDANTTKLENGKWYYVEGEVKMSHGLALADDAYIILKDGANLVIHASANEPGIAVRYTAGDSDNLYIYGQEKGTGRMEVYGGNNAAGIGGVCVDGQKRHCGEIFIYGGVIEAHGGAKAPGIGGSYYNDSNTGDGPVEFYLYGGEVKAYAGDENTPGVGGAWKNDDAGDEIFIYGGSIEAFGGKNCKGFGDGKGGNGSIAFKSSNKTLVWHKQSWVDDIGEYSNPEYVYTCTTPFVRIAVCEAVTASTSTFTRNQWYLINEKLERGTITVNGAAHLALGLAADLILTGENGKPGFEVTSGNSLGITGWGKLTANGSGSAPGIGGGNGTGGNVTICGGKTKVTAKGGGSAAAFGGTVSIDGGVFGMAVDDNWCADGYGAFDNPDPKTKDSYPYAVLPAYKVTVGKLEHMTAAWTSDDGVMHALDGEVFKVQRGTPGVKVIFTPDPAYELVSGGLVCSLGTVNANVTVTNLPQLRHRTVEYVDAKGETQPNNEFSVITAQTGTLESGWYLVEGVLERGTLTVNGTANLILADGAKLTVNGGIRVKGDNALNIYGQTKGTGELVANGGNYAAGIGGGSGGEGGNVTIYAGVVTATGGNYAAGIGGGSGGEGGNVTIYAGVVTATGGNNAAGIGGGVREYDKEGNYVGGDAGGEVTIYGGTVTATGGGCGAGIGGGDGGAGGDVTINGGIVTAKGGGSAAGIGGGKGGAGGDVTINGGIVTANGGNWGAGIGGGNGGAGGDVSINGGTVTANGGTYGAGIGGGWDGSGGAVTISGGIVTATGGDRAVGIGGGFQGSSAGTVKWDEKKVVVGAGSIGGSSVRLWEHTLSRTVRFPVVVGLSVRATVGGIEHTVTTTDGVNSVVVAAGDRLTLTFSPLIATVTVQGTNPVVVDVEEDTVLALHDLPTAGGVVTVPYRAWTGSGFEDAEAAAIVLNANVGQLLDGYWYVVTDTVERGTLPVSGTANLILADGAKLTVDGGIRVEGKNALNIYGQVKGTGELVANGGQDAAGIGGGYKGSGGTVTINGGIVTATGGSGLGGTPVGAGIGGGYNGSGGKVTINGGIVTANGGKYAAGIGGGDGGAGGTVTVDEEKVIVGAGSIGGSSVRLWEHTLSRTVRFPVVVGLSVRATVGGIEHTVTTTDGMNSVVVAAGDRLTLTFSPVIASVTVQGTNPVVVEVAEDTVLSSNALPTAGGVVTVPYRAWTGLGFEDAEATAVVLNANVGQLLDGYWYVVTNEVERGTLPVGGTANLILADGAKLTVGGGIRVEGGNALNIYGQAEGTGELVANGGQDAAGIGGYKGSGGTVTINGGIVTAKGGSGPGGTSGGAGIGGGYGGSGGEVMINGGVVTANGSKNAAGIGGGAYGSGGVVTINGGVVAANGGAGGAGIGGGNGGAAGTLSLGDDVVAYDITGGESGTLIQDKAMLTTVQKIRVVYEKAVGPTCAGGDIEKEGGVWVVTPTGNATEVEITGLPAGDSVVVPPSVTKVTGANDGKIIVKSGTVDITGAFTITGGAIALNPEGEVNGVKVQPTIGDLDDGEPFAVGEGSAAVTVKAIPGLKYELLRAEVLSAPVGEDANGTVWGVVGKPVVATEAMVKLTDDKPPADKAFYVIGVSVP